MIRLVPRDAPEPLSVDDAREGAKGAFRAAQVAQMDLVSHLDLSRRLVFPPASVSYYVLKGMRNQAREQVERAQAVVDALERAIEALERAAK